MRYLIQQGDTFKTLSEFQTIPIQLLASGVLVWAMHCTSWSCSGMSEVEQITERRVMLLTWRAAKNFSNVWRACPACSSPTSGCRNVRVFRETIDWEATCLPRPQMSLQARPHQRLPPIRWLQHCLFSRSEVVTSVASLSGGHFDFQQHRQMRSCNEHLFAPVYRIQSRQSRVQHLYHTSPWPSQLARGSVVTVRQPTWHILTSEILIRLVVSSYAHMLQ